jgi:single-stranded-DNA-specific exonuclease
MTISDADPAGPAHALPYFLGVESSLKGKAWRARLKDDRLALTLSQRLGVPEIIGRVMAGRNVLLEDADDFLTPSLKRLMPDPSSITDMDKAAHRLADAIVLNQNVSVFGDYDVDGATSSALLIRFMRGLGCEPGLYIPDREREGYGPNGPAMERLRKEGADLVLTVDCGTLSYEPLAHAAGLGLDVIVVDHHQAGQKLPQTAALINPNRLDDESDLGTLAAVGVAFLLCVATQRVLRDKNWFEETGQSMPDLMSFLDIVALGTVCDVVPLKGLNRAFVTQGLKVMAMRMNPGITALADVARMNEAPGVYHAGFLIGPRINAGGRVGRSDLGARILSTDDPSEAAGIAYELDRLNQERRDIEASVLGEAELAAERSVKEGDPSCLVVSGKGWHPGVIGIVASRLKERFGRPTFVLAIRDDGSVKGSGRSITGVDLGAATAGALEAGLLVNGGGHKMAAGVTLERKNIEGFAEFLDSKLKEDVALAMTRGGIKIDGALSVRGATRDLAETLLAAGPYGAGHPEPVFVLSDVSIIKADLVGDAHVRLILGGPDGARLKAIAFRVLDSPLGEALLSADGRSLHLAGKLKLDNWRGSKGVQFQVEDGTFA